MHDLALLAAGYFVGAIVTLWLRRQHWFDVMTSRLARVIDRIAGYP